MMTDETTATPENKTTSSENQETREATDIQASVETAHQAAKAHFSQYQTSISPTHEELRADADRAAEIVKNLHAAVATSTPKGSTLEVMNNDKKEAYKTRDDMAKGADPLAAYAGYSAYAFPQEKPDEGHRNYYEKPLAYDEYSISQDKKEYNVNYDLTEVTPGGLAKAVNSPNAITGTEISEKSFSYNEKKSGSNTIVATELTLQGKHTPSSYHINSGQSQVDEFTNKNTRTYVYDKDDRLIEQTCHFTSNDLIYDKEFVAHKKQDMSRSETKGYCRTATDITASRNNYTRFTYAEYTKDGMGKETLSGDLRKNAESYIHQKGNKLTEVRHSKNMKGEWVYEGHISQINGDTVISQEALSPQKAEKEFNNLRKTANKHIKDLTGSNGMSEYSQQLGEKKNNLSLDAIWNGHASSEDKAKAEQANAEISQKYANMPAAVIAIKAQNKR